MEVIRFFIVILFRKSTCLLISIKGIQLFFVLCLLLHIQGSWAQTNVSGNVSGTWTTAGSPYIITADIDVISSTTLTIDPGVEVRFDGNYQFQVHGKLTAVGTSTDSIKFTRNNPTEASKGKGIRFIFTSNGFSSEISKLSFCIIEHNNNSSSGGGVYASNSNLIIENSTIQNNQSTQGGGLYLSIGTGLSTGPTWTVIVRNCIIKNNIVPNSNINNNGGGGITATNHSDLNSNPTPSTIIIENNLIINNSHTGTNPFNFEGGGGIQVGRGVSIINNTIYGNTSIRGGAINFNDDSNAFSSGYYVTVANNIIYGNVGTYYSDEVFIDLFSSSCQTSVSQLIFENNIIGGAIKSQALCEVNSATLINAIIADNFFGDPLFQHTESENFKVQGTSPTIDAGNNSLVPLDISDLDNDFNTTEPVPFDIIGNNRFVDIASVVDQGTGTPPIVDIGANEMAVLPLSASTANSATSVTQSSFTAIWNAVSGAASYFLDVSNDNFSTYVSGYFNKEISGTSENVTSLNPGVQYKYRVRAGNNGGVSANSNVISQWTIPATPTANSATSVTQTSFTASWGAVTGADNYFLDVSTDNFSTFITGYNNKQITTGMMTGTSENITILNPATTYQYRVRSTNTGGTSPNSNVISQLTIPATPTATAATNITQTSFTTNWGAITGADNYRIDVSTSSGFSSFVTGYNNTSVAGTNTSVIGLASGITYYYRIRSENTIGLSPSSNTISQITIPKTPTVFPAANPTQTSFTANWNTETGASAYYMDVSEDNFSTFVTGYNGKQIIETIEDVNGLDPATNYQYRVRSGNTGGISPNSIVIVLLTIPATPTATAASNITQASFTANWGAIAGANSYRIDVLTGSSFPSFVTGYNNTSVPGTNVSVTGLASGITYYYRIRSENATGQSPNSNTISQITIPATPAINSAINVTQTSFTANWNTITGADDYFFGCIHG